MIRAPLIVLSVTMALGLAAWEATATQLTASWTDNSAGEAITRLERRVVDVTAFAPIADVPPGVTVFVDTSVSAATTYCYRAAAYDDAGVSPYSDEACATTPSDNEPALDLAVIKHGAGSGTIVSNPAGILCGTDCTATYAAGTVVTLSATPSPGSTFPGWSRGCSGTEPCAVTGNGRVSVTATFTAQTRLIAVSKVGETAGAVVSSPAGIQCGSTCFATYPAATTVTLTAIAAPGSTFSGWSGGCTGTGPCTLAGGGWASVIATFAPGPTRLDVTAASLD
jgi:Divergent InlB B-repeat domain